MPAASKLYRAMAETIAGNLKDCTSSQQKAAIKLLVLDLCTDFKQDNIHFNKEKFLDACGL
jgi:hypothetical protein